MSGNDSHTQECLSEEGLDIEPRTFRMSPELRRAGMYATIGLIVALVVARLVGNSAPEPSTGKGLAVVGETLLFLAWLLFALAPAVAAYSWQLRVDETGLHRIFLHFFRRTWSWDSFRSGKVLYRKRTSDKKHVSFADSLALADEDAELLFSIIDGIWTPPELPLPPSRLELKHRPRVRRHALVFHEGGIDAMLAGTHRSYSWADVEAVTLVRGNWREQGFRKCRITLPHGTLALVEERGKTNWRGADDRTIEAVLRAHLPQEKLVTGALWGTPRTVADCDVRIDWIEPYVRQLRWIIPFVTVLSAIFVGKTVYRPPAELTWVYIVALSLGLLVIGSLLFAFIFVYRYQRRELAKLEAKRDELLNRTDTSP